MPIDYDDIENAFMFVNLTPMYGNQVILCKQTGRTFYISESGDSDELPEDIDDSEDYIDIPHKNELDLGQDLVFRFVSEHLPDEFDTVQGFFRRKGAYGRYKNLLERKGLLDQWYDFEDSERKKALRAWCEENMIDISG